MKWDAAASRAVTSVTLLFQVHLVVSTDIFASRRPEEARIPQHVSNGGTQNTVVSNPLRSIDCLTRRSVKAYEVVSDAKFSGRRAKSRKSKMRVPRLKDRYDFPT